MKIDVDVIIAKREKAVLDAATQVDWAISDMLDFPEDADLNLSNFKAAVKIYLESVQRLSNWLQKKEIKTLRGCTQAEQERKIYNQLKNLI